MNVILVDENDRELGVMEKLEAHQKGLLHRAFSVFIFNQKKELLLQRRAMGKYHSEGLWTNTCCSHPAPGESLENAGKRRLLEEMGMDCELSHAFSFIYQVAVDNKLTEYELDHVLIGFSNRDPFPNCNEAMDFKWISLENLRKETEVNPDQYTAWFKIILEDYYSSLIDQLAIKKSNQTE